MTVIYSTDYNTKCSAVTFQSNECAKIQKFNEISNDENNILYKKPLKTFLSKSKVCDMTLMSGALDKSVVDGNTILLKISEECGRHRYTCIGGDVVCSFLINDDVYQYTSNMRNNLTPYSIAIGEKNIRFFTPHFKFIKRDRIDDYELLSTNENSVDPFDYLLSNCGKDSPKKCEDIKFIQIMIRTVDII